MAMKEQWLRFIREYQIDGNAREAAIRAGYSPATARKTGPKLLKHPDVARAVATIEQHALLQIGVNKSRILTGIEEMAFPAHDKPVLARDRLKALELLAKYLGMFTEKKEISGPHGGPVRVQSWVDLMADDDTPALEAAEEDEDEDDLEEDVTT